MPDAGNISTCRRKMITSGHGVTACPKKKVCREQKRRFPPKTEDVFCRKVALGMKGFLQDTYTFLNFFSFQGGVQCGGVENISCFTLSNVCSIICPK